MLKNIIDSSKHGDIWNELYVLEKEYETKIKIINKVKQFIISNGKIPDKVIIDYIHGKLLDLGPRCNKLRVKIIKHMLKICNEYSFIKLDLLGLLNQLNNNNYDEINEKYKILIGKSHKSEIYYYPKWLKKLYFENDDCDYIDKINTNSHLYSSISWGGGGAFSSFITLFDEEHKVKTLELPYGYAVQSINDDGSIIFLGKTIQNVPEKILDNTLNIEVNNIFYEETMYVEDDMDEYENIF